MFPRPTSDRTVKGSALRAAVFATLSSALAAGLHHATGDSPVSLPAVGLAACVLFLGAFAVFALCSPRMTSGVLAAAQAFLPVWLNTTESRTVWEGHFRLPPAWHHSGPTMALLNLVVALALAWLLRGARELPARLVNACLDPARQWLVRLAGALGLFLPASHGGAAPLPLRRSSDTPPSPVAFLALRYQRVPCGP